MTPQAIRHISEADIFDILPAVAIAKPGSAMRARQNKIIENFVAMVNAFAEPYGFDSAVNLSRFIGQVGIEADYFRTTTEYASGKAYERRTDLGNTPVDDGDGPKYKGRGLIQTTGRNNVENFSRWAAKNLRSLVAEPIPDFVKQPEKIADHPWAFWSAIYFWAIGNRTSKSLNRYAQENNDEMLTRVINGGLTHFDRRLDMTARAALVLLGFKPYPEPIKKFQRQNGLVADGIIGRRTRDALHLALKEKDATAQAARKSPPPSAVQEKARTEEEALAGAMEDQAKRDAAGGGFLLAILRLFGMSR